LAMAVLVLFLVGAPGDNGSPQRSKEIYFALAQSVRAQSAPATPIPTCERLLTAALIRIDPAANSRRGRTNPQHLRS
jgi:hypothetical protein